MVTSDSSESSATPILIDTDILIEVFRKRDAPILTKWDKLADSDQLLLISPVSIAEIWGGVRATEISPLQALLDSLTPTVIDQATGLLAGEFFNQYRKSHNLQIPDCLIAAEAVLHRAALWTRNKKHYPMPQIAFYS